MKYLRHIISVLVILLIIVLAAGTVIVRIGEGHQLPKFQMRGNNTKLYIPQDNVDYAVVNADAQGEIALNFKANADGQYTITVNPEGVELGYLHLIDNMTGADVDLLHPETVIAGEDPQSPAPSYTFTAKTTDYESRFKLVFAADSNSENADDGTEAFAFISNGNIIVNGTGTLQVIDVTGRIVRCADVARHVSTNGMTAGVYVLRLINGDDVKTQKIVIN